MTKSVVTSAYCAAGGLYVGASDWQDAPTGPPISVLECVMENRKVNNEILSNIPRKHANTARQGRVETRPDYGAIDGGAVQQKSRRWSDTDSYAYGFNYRQNAPPCGYAATYHQTTRSIANAVARG